MNLADAEASGALTGPARRRARTRAALLKAGRELLAAGREQASIEEITKAAGVGFGSFFNHFPDGKEDFFAESVLELLDLYALWVRSATDPIDDPAEKFAVSFRLTGRLAANEPELLAPLLSRGTELLLVRRGLREAAMADLELGVAEERFSALDPEIHLVTVGGVLLGLTRLVFEAPERVGDEVIDQVAAGALRLLGVDATEADRLISLPVPDLPDLALG